MWAKFDCGASGGADAYAQKTISLPTAYWLQVDVQIPTATLTACTDHDLFGATAQLLQLGLVNTATIEGFDTSYPSGAWKWRADGLITTSIPLAAATTYTIKAHVSGTSNVDWYIDGTLLRSETARTTTRDGFIIGGLGSEECTCEWYYITNVKVGTSDGGSDIFADDFSSGDFSNWSSTTGACSVASAPTGCSTIPSISPSPAGGCFGDTITVTGSGFAASSPLTVTLCGVAVTFSETNTDGSGNVSGTFDIPPVTACGGCSCALEVMDGGGNTATVVLDLCCDRAADILDSASQVGPYFSTTVEQTPLDYIHHNGAHWVVVLNQPDPSALTVFPPDPSYKPLTVYRIPDGGASISSFDLQLGYQFKFGNASFYHCELTDPTCGVTDIYWDNPWWFESWAQPVYDARFGSDGTTLWLGVLTRETVAYPYSTIGSVDLETLTSGYTDFVTSESGVTRDWNDSTCPPTPGPGANSYDPLVRSSIGALDFCHQSAFPVDDGGAAFSSNWDPPRVVMFSYGGSAFSRIGTMDAKYCPGTVHRPSTCVSIANGAPQGSFFSGISLAADSSDLGNCHLLWSEGGDWGTYGLATTVGGCNVPLVWDGGPQNRDYRVGYATFSTSAKTGEYDLFHSHVDRTSWDFTYDGTPNGYTWPATADLALSDCFSVVNAGGIPLLLISMGQTIQQTWKPNDGSGNPWLDYQASYGDPALKAYDLTGGTATLLQTLSGTLLPDTAEIGYDAALVQATFAEGFNPIAFLSVSDLYTDPLLSSTNVFLVALGVTSTTGSPPHSEPGAVAFYRIPADGSATFDYMDGLRAVGYSIVRTNLANTRRFVSETNNVWSASGGPYQLDRQCVPLWTSYTVGLAQGDIYFDGSHTLFGVGPYGRAGGSSIDRFAITAVNICRGCRPCSCGTLGLHIWQHL